MTSISLLLRHYPRCFYSRSRGQWPRLCSLNLFRVRDDETGDQPKGNLRCNEPSPRNLRVKRRIDEAQSRGNQRSPQNGSQETSPEGGEARRHHRQNRRVEETHEQRNESMTEERDNETR